MPSTITCRPEDLPREIEKIFRDALFYNKKVIAGMVVKLPGRLERRSKQYMRKVFKKQHGARGIIGSVIGIGKAAMENIYEIGLESNKIYANIQHWGGYIKPHGIKPKHPGKAGWARALRFEKGGAVIFAKRVHHPGCYIKPKYFFRFPIAVEGSLLIKEMKAAIGLGP